MNLKARFSLISLMFKRRSIKEIVKKNIEIIWGYPLYVLSCITPRNKKKWLVGSHVGFSGNPKYFFIYVVAECKMKKCYWIAATRAEERKIRELGFPAYYRWSIKGVFHSITAGTYIYGFHLIDVNFWTSGGVKRINLWHGVGIKNIEFKSTKGSAGKIYDEKNFFSRVYLPYLFKRPHLFLSTSPLMTEHFKQCFRITDKECIEGIYPRCDIFRWQSEKLKQFIYQYESAESLALIEKLKKCRKSYLYMPTWRETRENFIVSAGFDFVLLNEVLRQRDNLFLLKLHPESNLSMEEMSRYSNILVLDKKIDIYPVLPFTDVLVTDYSSIYYDYLLMPGKEVLLFPFDYAEYITAGRDLAFDFDKYTPGKRVHTFEELLTVIRDEVSLQFDEREWIVNQFWNYTYTISSLVMKIKTLA